MTESVIEKLLKQMSLKEASTELDDRVARVLNAPNVVSRADGSRARSRAMVTVVAVACLVVGAGVGLALGRASAVREGLSPDNDLTGVDERDSDHQRSESAEESEVVDSEIDLSDFATLDRLRGPQVAMLCALNGYWAPDSNEARCLRCHHGITDAQARFRDEHVRSVRFQTCAVCHDGAAMDGVINPREEVIQ